MKIAFEGARLYVRPGSTDLRKGVTGLLAIIENEMLLDSSKTKEAINYCLNRWENLENFIKYPGATFSTNAAERSVKSWVMARRNFLFSGSGNGARAS